MVDSLRGSHSTGACFVDTQEEVSVVKCGADPFELFQNGKFKNKFKNILNVLMGHNRYATTGAVNKTNAHPFDFDSLVGAHNGTLTTKHLLDNPTDFVVDSENLFYHMSKHGVQATAPLLGGAYALSWYDKGNGTINFLRNKERPLYYTRTNDGATLFWASEYWMLESILDRNFIKYGEIIEFEVGKHYQLPIDFGIPARVSLQPDFDVEPVTQYKPKKIVHITGGNSRASLLTQQYMKHNALLATDVTFYLTGSTTVGNHTNYLSGTMSGDHEVQVRIYKGKNLDLWESLEDAALETGIRYFKGEAKKLSCSPYCYLLIDLRSVVEVFLGMGNTLGNEADWGDQQNPVPDSELMYSGYRGEDLTEKEFFDKTAVGCAWCSDIPQLVESEEITWISANEHVCVSCCNDPEIQDIVNQNT